MRHNQIVSIFLLIYVEHESVWLGVSELDFKNTYSLLSGEVKF